MTQWFQKVKGVGGNAGVGGGGGGAEGCHQCEEVSGRRHCAEDTHTSIPIMLDMSRLHM